MRWTIAAAACLVFAGGVQAETASLITDGAVALNLGQLSCQDDIHYGAVSIGFNEYDSRVVMEFDLSGLARCPRSAALTIDQLGVDPHGGPPVSLWAYAGDGAIATSDFEAAASYVCQVSYPTGYNFGYGDPFATDVRSALELAWASGWDRIAFRLQPDYWPGHDAGLTVALDGPVQSDVGGLPPRLAFEMAHAGDANFDDVVDVGDLGILALNWMRCPRTWEQGDFDGTRGVDVADLGVLAANWGWAGAPAGGGTVPEPASMLLLLVGLQAMFPRARPRNGTA